MKNKINELMRSVKLKQIEKFNLELIKLLISEEDYLKINTDLVFNISSNYKFTFENMILEIGIENKPTLRVANEKTIYYKKTLTIRYGNELTLFISNISDLLNIISLNYFSFIKFIYDNAPLNYFNNQLNDYFNNFSLCKQCTLEDYGL